MHAHGTHHTHTFHIIPHTHTHVHRGTPLAPQHICIISDNCSFPLHVFCLWAIFRRNGFVLVRRIGRRHVEFGGEASCHTWNMTDWVGHEWQELTEMFGTEAEHLVVGGH